MADWSQLPNDLLHLISTRLPSPLDVIRLRSVCSTWQSATTPPKHHRFASRIPFVPSTHGMVGYSSSDYYTLLKRTVFLFRPPKTNTQSDPLPSISWIIKIQHVHDHAPNNKTRFLDPLSGAHSITLPYKFPKRSNMLDYSVIELGEEYVLDFDHDYSTHPAGIDLCIYMKKVVFTYLDSSANEFVTLSINGYGSLAMFKSSDHKWTIIRDTPSYYDDVISYKGNFYAVDSKGRVVLVGLDSETSVVGVPAAYNGVGYDDVKFYKGNLYVVDARGTAVLWDSSKKYLIESNGELLFVDKFLSLVVEEGSCVCVYKFNVYKLDEVNKEWIEVNSLDDRVLFLGIKRGFTALIKDLSLCRGNYIIFVDIFKPRESWDPCVFDLETGSAQPLRMFPQFDKLFSPPSSWISSRILKLNRRWKKLKAKKMKLIKDKIAKLMGKKTSSNKVEEVTI